MGTVFVMVSPEHVTVKSKRNDVIMIKVCRVKGQFAANVIQK